MYYLYNDLYYDLQVSQPDRSVRSFRLTADRICADDQVNDRWCVPSDAPDTPYLQDGQEIVWSPIETGEIRVIPDLNAYKNMSCVNETNGKSAGYQTMKDL